MARRIDQLGLRAAMADRMLPVLVAAMSFLAALALAGALAAAALSAHWQGETGAALTIQVPAPGDPAANGAGTRSQAVLAALAANQAVGTPHALTGAQMDALLKPWLGSDLAQLSVPLPAVISASWHGTAPPDDLRAALDRAAPGTLVQTGALWAGRVASLTASIQAAAAAVLLIVAFVSAAVVSIATRAGLAQRREAVEIVHGLGALDGDIAARFAGRATWLAGLGAALGAALALPALFWLAALATPFIGLAPTSLASALPIALWAGLFLLPAAAASIGWATAQYTVRGWLRRLR